MANFELTPAFDAVVPDDQSTFTRTFEHRDWVDGQDLVQAGATPDEAGMNVRLNALEKDLDAVKADLVHSYKLVADLRKALSTALTQIGIELNKKTEKPNKEGKEQKDGKETKEGKEKDGKEDKEGKEGKESKEGKEHKDGKETKESKEDKDGKEGMNAAEKNDHGRSPLDAGPPPTFFDDADEEPAGRAFIRAAERPQVGARILAREPVEPSPLP